MSNFNAKKTRESVLDQNFATFWIRIRFRNPDPEPRTKKIKVEKSFLVTFFKFLQMTGI
jgi:hypothetical protein